MATVYPIISGKKIAFRKIIAAIKNAAVSKNLKASRRYSVFTMLLGFFSFLANKTLTNAERLKQQLSCQ